MRSTFSFLYEAKNINKKIQYDMKTVNYALAALGGAVVGAAAAILLAPEKGSKTRESIVDFIKSHCPAIKESKLQQLADRISEEIKEAKI